MRSNHVCMKNQRLLILQKSFLKNKEDFIKKDANMKMNKTLQCNGESFYHILLGFAPNWNYKRSKEYISEEF